LHRIDDLDPHKIFLVIAAHHAVLRFGDGGDDGVERAARVAFCLPSAIRRARIKTAALSKASTRPVLRA
jgi:hypothetical protein